MNAAELRAIIRDAILELMVPPPRRGLVLFTGGLLGFDEAIESLRRLAATGVSLDYLQTPSAERILDQDRIASLGMRPAGRGVVTSHDLLIAPTLTANIAAKVAHGVSDCLASNLFAEFLMANRLVIASHTPVCPDGAAKQSWFPNMPAGYADLLRNNLSALASYGVRLTGSATLCRTAVAAWDRRDAARRAPLVEVMGTSVAGFMAELAAQVEAAGGARRMLVPTAVAPRGTSGFETKAEVVPCQLSLISHQVIQRLPSGVELRIGAKTKVTAAAQDAAAARTIRITREA